MAVVKTEHDTELIPGTEILLQGHDGSSRDSDNLDKLVLIPTPSNNPDDPLNWSPTWKATVIINQAIFVFISILTPLAIAPLTPIFMEEFHTTLPKVNMLFGAAAMALGYANFIIVPFSNVFGRRPTILICGLLCILANIWQAKVTSYNSFIGARVISGLGAAANESIMPMVVADVYFLHERGLWMGLYFWAYFIGVFIGPIISGNIADHVSWRWFFWVCTMAQGVNLIMMVFMFPETRYNRPSTSSSSITSSSANDHPIGIEDEESINVVVQTSQKSAEKLTQTQEEKEKATATLIFSRMPSDDHVQDVSSHRPVGRPSKAQFSLIPKSRFEGKETIFRDIIAPLQIFTFPIICWVAFAFAFATNCLLALNLTQSQVFAAPPYLFNPAEVGFVNFAFVVGGVIGLLTAGPFSDWVSMRATVKNKGVREAEMRLISLLPYIAICLVGMVVVAVGYQRKWPWEAIVIIGYGFAGIIVVAIPAILIAYAVDCYKHLPGQIMVCATVVKNTWGFGMIFYFNDWAVTQGFLPPILTWMALAVGVTMIGMVVFIFYGKSFRRRTANSKQHRI